MSITPKILAFAGSTREHSWNKKLIGIAAESARHAGAEVTLVDLRDFPMPLYDEDFETREGLPEGARRFKALMASHHGFLISSPEYNSGYPAIVKNTIDWATRPAPSEKPLLCFSGKMAALLAASPGRLGGIRMLPQLRVLLSNLMVNVIPEQLAVPSADKAFTPEGKLVDPGTQKLVDSLATALVTTLRKLNS